jgi:hypothetical protein
MPPLLSPPRLRLGRSRVVGLLEALQQVLEPVGDALAQHVVVDALKDVADPSLILSAEASPSLPNLRVGMHDRL